MKPQRRVFSFLAALVSSCSIAAEANAAGISVARFGAELGHPTTTNATAIYYNPAGVADSRGFHLFGDVNAAWRHLVYERGPSSSDDPVPPGAEGANVGRASLFNLAATPFAGATYRFEDLTVGLAVYVPYGGQSSWSANDAFAGNLQYPGAVDGVQRWYSIDGELRSTYLSLALAYDFGPLSVGLSGNVIQTVVNTLRARDPAGGDSLAREGRVLLDARSYDASFGVGVVYEPIDTLRLGVSYQARPNFGHGITASGQLKTIFESGSRETNDVEFATDLPDVWRVGASYRPRDDVELRLFGDYQRWSVLDNQCVSPPGAECRVTRDGSPASGSDVILNQVRNWSDTFGVRAGVSLWSSPDLEWIAGVGYSSNAVPDETLEPALPDFDNISAALGLRVRMSDSFFLASTYTQIFSITRDTSGESIHPTLRGPNGVTSPSRSPDSSGAYSQQLGVLNVNVDYEF